MQLREKKVKYSMAEISFHNIPIHQDKKKYGHSFSKRWTASRALRTQLRHSGKNNGSLSNGVLKCYADLDFTFDSHQKMTHRAKERQSMAKQ